MLIIDEADLLFSFGYDDDVRKLLKHLPRTCQTFLMSATLTPVSFDPPSQFLQRNSDFNIDLLKMSRTWKNSNTWCWRMRWVTSVPLPRSRIVLTSIQSNIGGAQAWGEPVWRVEVGPIQREVTISFPVSCFVFSLLTLLHFTSILGAAARTNTSFCTSFWRWGSLVGNGSLLLIWSVLVLVLVLVHNNISTQL